MDGAAEGGLLATPGGYRDGPLENLPSEAISSLMKAGYAVVPDFVGPQVRKSVLKELELREFDGQFTDLYQQSVAQLHSDHFAWIALSDVNRVSEPGLHRLVNKMLALPYELNLKAKLLLQVGAYFKLSCYPPKDSFFKKHFDNSFEKKFDNGKKVTALYFPNAPGWDAAADGGVLRIYTTRRRRQAPAAADGDPEPFVDLLPGPDCLVLMRSREMAYEVRPCRRKRFEVGLWFGGVQGPGDDDDGSRAS